MTGGSELNQRWRDSSSNEEKAGISVLSGFLDQMRRVMIKLGRAS